MSTSAWPVSLITATLGYAITTLIVAALTSGLARSSVAGRTLDLVLGYCGCGFTIPQQHRLTSNKLDYSQIILGFYVTTVSLGATSAELLHCGLVDALSLPLVGAALIALGSSPAEWLDISAAKNGSPIALRPVLPFRKSMEGCSI
jgi:hypothetical protein